MSRLLLLSSLIVLGVGCASSMANPRATGGAMPLGYQGSEPLAVQGSYITGPTSSLVIADDELNGRYRDLPVALKWTYQELTGMVGTRSTRLELAEGDDTRIWGSFGGMPVDLTLEPEWVFGRMGDCSYALKRVESGFVGKRSCGGPLEGEFDLAFPEPLMQRPLGEKAALMALMLANHHESYNANVTLANFARLRDSEYARNVKRCAPYK